MLDNGGLEVTYAIRHVLGVSALLHRAAVRLRRRGRQHATV